MSFGLRKLTDISLQAICIGLDCDLVLADNDFIKDMECQWFVDHGLFLANNNNFDLKIWNMNSLSWDLFYTFRYGKKNESLWFV